MGIMGLPYDTVLDVSANTLLGNNTGSTAAAIALTASQVRTLLSVYTSAQVDTLLAGYQPLDADLTAIAALTTTSFGRSLLTQADAAATRTTIGAGTSSFSGAYGDLSGIPGTFTPSAHKASHATGGSDALTAADIGAVPTARTLTINGTTQDLSANRTFTVSAGISSLNGLTDATQTFAVGTTGTDVAFSSAAGVHTLNVPDASATARGLVTTGTQTFAGNKTFTGANGLYVGSTDYQFVSSGDELQIRNNKVATNAFIRVFSRNTEILLIRNTQWETVLNLSGGITIGRSGTSNRTELFAQSTGVLYQRDSNTGINTPQKYYLANIHTSDTSYERLEASWASNACTIEVTKGSAGGTLRGLKIGGASTSLLGFYGATPVDRPDTVADPTGGSTIDAEARTAINAIIDRLQELGLIT